jgi:CRISPR system Cascade subunit CasD
MAVKIEASGLPLTDFHTAQVPSAGKGRNRIVFSSRRDELVRTPRRELNTVLSRREYRQDAYSLVALWAREKAPYSLEALRLHLLTPHFVLYLGRKACPPALPVHPRVIRAENVEAALATVTLSRVLGQLWDEGVARRTIEKLSSGTSWLLWDHDAQTQTPGEAAETISRRDVPLSRRRWQFAMRVEHRALLGKEAQP